MNTFDCLVRLSALKLVAFNSQRAQMPDLTGDVYYAPAGGARPYEKGRVASDDGGAQVVVSRAAGEPLRLPRASVWRRSPEVAGGVADSAQLFFLDEPNLLDNLELRYGADAIYTYTGTVLLALNPYKRLPALYTEEAMERYSGRALGVLPPHVYAIADRARRMLISEARDQSIVVSGESGAGKTESCRALVTYLAHHSRRESGALADALIAANPVLEAFGCAVTVRNRNSSRFGKLMKIHTAEASAQFAQFGRAILRPRNSVAQFTDAPRAAALPRARRSRTRRCSPTCWRRGASRTSRRASETFTSSTSSSLAARRRRPAPTGTPSVPRSTRRPAPTTSSARAATSSTPTRRRSCTTRRPPTSRGWPPRSPPSAPTRARPSHAGASSPPSSTWATSPSRRR